jgi:hypothetical protein
MGNFFRPVNWQVGFGGQWGLESKKKSGKQKLLKNLN